MKDQAVEGAIVNVASVAAVTGGLAPAAYTASKYAVVGLTSQVRAAMVVIPLQSAVPAINKFCCNLRLPGADPDNKP